MSGSEQRGLESKDLNHLACHVDKRFLDISRVEWVLVLVAYICTVVITNKVCSFLINWAPQSHSLGTSVVVRTTYVFHAQTLERTNCLESYISLPSGQMISFHYL